MSSELVFDDFSSLHLSLGNIICIILYAFHEIKYIRLYYICRAYLLFKHLLRCSDAISTLVDAFFLMVAKCLVHYQE